MGVLPAYQTPNDICDVPYRRALEQNRTISLASSTLETRQAVTSATLKISEVSHHVEQMFAQ